MASTALDEPLAPPRETTDRGVRAEVGNIGAIEGLRGVAVAWIVVFHWFVVRGVANGDPLNALIASSKPLTVIASNGYLAVDLFFLITGFLLTLPWWRHAAQGKPPPSAREFYRRRIHRIVPAYYVQLAFLFAVAVPLLRGADYWRRDIEYLAYNIAAHVTFLHYTTPLSSASYSANGALWTLTLEAQYYALLPLIAMLFVRAPWRTGAALIAAGIAWHWAAWHDLAPLVEIEMWFGKPWNPEESKIRHLLVTQLPAYLAHFAAGILIGRAWLRWRGTRAGPRAQWAWYAGAAAALALLYWVHAVGNAWLGEWGWLPTLAALAFLMLALVARDLPLARPLLANAPLTFLGRISYSVYLYHLPLLLVWTRHSPIQGRLAAPAYAALLLAIGWLSYRFVELPFMRPGAQRAGLKRNTEDTE